MKRRAVIEGDLMNRRKILLALLALLALGATPLAEAQQAAKVPRIGYLGGSSALPFHDGFRGAFQQLRLPRGRERGHRLSLVWRLVPTGEGAGNGTPPEQG